MEHIWCLETWQNYIDISDNRYKSGLHMHFEKGIAPEVREFLILFAKWLRKEYCFPLRVNVYVKRAQRIRAMDGDFVVGTIWRPLDYLSFPYIRLAVGDYEDLVLTRGKEKAMWAILHTFAHELTHYFQHINNLSLTSIGEERQATVYSNYILEEYATAWDTLGQGGHKTQDRGPQKTGGQGDGSVVPTEKTK